MERFGFRLESCWRRGEPNPLDFIEEVSISWRPASTPEGADMNKMPEAMEHYWAMWNELDLDLVRGHLDQAVSDDFLFADPINFHQGRDALEANVREFRADRPTAGFAVASRLDSHNRRYRYEWNLIEDSEVTLRGFDVTTLSDDGLIERIDGFFGPLRPLRRKADD